MANKFWRLLIVFAILAATPCTTAIAKDGQMLSVRIRLCVYWLPVSGPDVSIGTRQAKGYRYRVHAGRAGEDHDHQPRIRILRHFL